MGITNSEMKKIDTTLIEAITPNCLSKVLSVKIKVAKPIAVVRLVSRVTFPTLRITLISDLAWLPCLLISC